MSETYCKDITTIRLERLEYLIGAIEREHGKDSLTNEARIIVKAWLKSKAPEVKDAD